MDSKYFLSCTYFCDTKIVQQHLSNLGLSSIIPDTYDQRFKAYFNREIEMLPFTEFLQKYRGQARFVKPVSNNKDFSGCVIESLDDFENRGCEKPNVNQMIYTCKPVDFITEIRLLIGNHQLYADAHVSGKRNSSWKKEENMIQDLIKIIGDQFLCIDLGLIRIEKEAVVKYQWSIIEINPSFSLDDHGMPFDQYINFYDTACKCIYKYYYNKNFTMKSVS